jgi:homocysteine S-methyltransferase
MRGAEFLERLREEVLLGDGAIGTMLSERVDGRDVHYERLNLTQPELVRELHAAYLQAGARVLETNTFGANRTKLNVQHEADDVAAVNWAGVRLAREVAGHKAFVAGSVGPLAHRRDAFDQGLTDDDIRHIFREQILALAEAGVDLLMLETFSDLKQLLLALEVAKQETALPVVCQMALHEHGHTQAGVHVLAAAEALTKAGADVVGANCGRGVLCVATAVELLTKHCPLPISAFPNAGLPAYVDGRYRFGAPGPYMVEKALEMVRQGVGLIGGCCGTTPAYIALLQEKLQGVHLAVRTVVPFVAPLPDEAVTVAPRTEPPTESILHREQGPLIVVELDPPRNLRYEPILRRARQLADMGVDAITMADNAVATLRMGNLGLAVITQKEVGVPVVAHFTCRDHNLIGMQSLLMMAHVTGIRHLLALTGDPARVGDHAEATNVYDLNSFGLVELISKFNQGLTHGGQPLGEPTQFTIGVAFNPNVRNMAGQVARLRKKVAHGAHFAMTQPVYDMATYRQMKALTADLKLPILVGIMPLLSERNAEFLHNEVPGIQLSDEVRRRMKGLAGAEGRAMGLKICQELIDAMLPDADGFYLIPPQIRLELGAELVAYLNERLPQRSPAPRLGPPTLAPGFTEALRRSAYT